MFKISGLLISLTSCTIQRGISILKIVSKKCHSVYAYHVHVSVIIRNFVRETNDGVRPPTPHERPETKLYNVTKNGLVPAQATRVCIPADVK